MAAVIAGAEIVAQAGAEGFGDGVVFGEGAVFAVCVVHGHGLRRDVFGYPGGIACATVICAMQGEGSDGVGDGAGEAILEDAGGVDGAGGFGRGGFWSGAVEGGKPLLLWWWW